MKIFRVAAIAFEMLIFFGCGTSSAEHMTINDIKYSNIPSIVVKFADAQEPNLPNSFKCRHSGPCGDYISEYAENFLDGFLNSGGIGGFADDEKAEEAAYKAGQVYWRDNPSQRFPVLEGYGYTYKESSGVWLVTRHESVFSPDDQKNEMWWVLFLEKSGVDSIPQSAKEILPGLGFRVRIKVSGYVSPGSYGKAFLITPHRILISHVSTDR